MFRQGLRRCGALARIAPTSSLFVSRSGLPAARQAAASLSRPIAPLKNLARLDRSYSKEAAAEREEASLAGATGDIVNFADLEKLGVHPNLLNAITKGMGYDAMTPVQAKTIAPALKGTDIVAQAKTGTGKTLAFLLPLLQRMIQEDPTLATKSASRTARSDDIRGIVMSPTRELAEQIATEAKRLTEKTGLVVQSAVGGTHKASMLRQTQRQGCHLMVATPGRLNDLLQDPSSGIEAPNLAALVLDEADRMLDVGFEKELNEIQKSLPSRSEKVRQTMLVSATIPDDVIRLARSMVRPNDFEFVQTIAENEVLTHDRIPQNVVPVKSWGNVFPALFELIDREVAASKADPDAPNFKAIVYFNTTALVELAGEYGFLRRKSGGMKVPTFSISSNLTQNARTKAADMFREFKSGVLFSSDVTARGMDFPDVTHVIQVDCPRDRESYIHRLGRTGRQGKGGQGWLLVTPTSANGARRMLRGLPLQPNTSLESPDVDLAAVDALPKYHEQVQALTSTVPRRMLGSTYTSIFGGVVEGREDLVDDLNLWATKGWGWDEPPTVTSSWARNLGLARSNLNINDEARMDRDVRDRRDGSRNRYDDRDGGRFGDRRGGGDRYGDRRGGGDRHGDRRGGDRRGGFQSRKPRDAFEEMGRRVHKESRDNRGHSRSTW
ncbi:ATP-dependent RNA helicase mss116 [Escovopsis weberi]|uniref:ATP-dependent RNA helicase n=1 Tax=Escovopsis weberi TaxID=150374 RepID=A0A0M8N029_ESCWE|nr:ATP-dependent RNA helicase mss116 [Escovopsis weberi]